VEATVEVTVDTYASGDPDRLGVTEPDYTTTTGLYAYWLLTKSQTNDTVVGTYTETGELGVPSTFPTVAPGDKITVAGRVWAVDGDPVDYSLGPFTDRWVTLTGEKPCTVIHLRRVVNTIPGGS